MKVVVLGLTITSAWGNGHATTFRSLLKALARRGHTIVFVEKDVEWYRSHRDLPAPDFCQVMFYEDWPQAAPAILQTCADADAIVIGSYFPDAKTAIPALADAGRGPLMFYDIDTPITLAALRANGQCAYLDAALIPLFAAYLSFTGGPALQELETRFHARRAVAFYCSVDPDLYCPTAPDARFTCDLSYLGTYAPDRQPKLRRLLMQPAALLPKRSFIVAGAMYPPDLAACANTRRIEHVAPPDHPGFYSSARFTLNLTRNDMVTAGYSPSVRLFEASACGACILSDNWAGIDDFFKSGEQILLPRDEYEVADILLHLTESAQAHIGRGARERTLAHHSSARRAQEFEASVSELSRSQ